MVFVSIVTVQVAIAAVSLDLLSAVRAYVTGESLYSKGQKDAQIHLLAYAETHRDEDYQRFREALAVPLGDREAREALQQAEPDEARARQGFVQGGNHAEDIDGLIRLFRWFHGVPFMADAIRTWSEGDQVIEEMGNLVERARERLQAGEADAEAIRQLRVQAPALNGRLTLLERRFSAQLGDASRQTQRLLLGLNLALAVLLASTGLWLIRHSLRRQAQAENEVRRRQERLQQLLDSAAEGLYGVDARGRCTFVNRAALAMLGYDDEHELLGHDIHVLIPSDTGATPHGLVSVGRAREHLHAANEKFRRRDDASIAVEYWAHPMLSDERMRGAVVTFFDIGERLRMQATLQQSELRLAKLVDAVTDGVVTVDADENIVLFNRAAERLFGVLADQAIGTPLRCFIPDGAQHEPHAALAQPNGVVHELVGLRADGQSFPLEATVSHMVADRGVLMTVVLRDVTVLHAARREREAREAMEATNRAKTDFLSRMSHELRTPLNAVLGFAQLLRMDGEEPATARHIGWIGHIEHAGHHLLALVNDVLDMSRVESGQMALSLETVDVRSVVDESLALVARLAAEHGIALVRDGPGESSAAGSERLGWVMADRVRLRQVLVNLLSNAVKYNRPSGSVTVRWATTGEVCRLQVVDTGHGLSPERLAHLFEPFNRLGAEQSQVEGTGIGLVVSRSLIDLMGGELRVDSEVGVGTTAILTLCRSDRAPEIPAALAPLSQHGELDAVLSVLYAEDNEVNIELVRQVVSFRPSVALRVAHSGTRALEMARSDPPDLMLVDMHLGDMTGMELARALRRHGATARVRLVALSADALPGQIRGALDFGFEDYLTKPVEFRRLLHVFDEHLRQTDAHSVPDHTQERA